MRLFSLSRNLELNETQKDDFYVISEEIRHIDQIVQNFLEFSRPPKLKMQAVCPSTIVDNALQLLAHRLKSYNVNIAKKRKQLMPVVNADPEQLKEVLVNIIVNACEAMSNGGTITIEEQVINEWSAETVIIRIQDTGPGIPASIRQKVFEPFFTTKDEGSGLGLSIAASIIEEHGGWLTVTSEDAVGATFNIALPTKENTP
jgi:signal transduction histidine kinase